MSDFYDWSQTAATNASADSTITWAENQNPDTVNDSARAMMARIAAFRSDIAPTRVSAGTGNAYTVTSNAGGTGSYRDGEIATFIVDRANTSACTLNVNGRGAVAFRPEIGREFAAGEIRANQPIIAFYRSASNEWLAVGSAYQINALTGGVLLQSVVGRLTAIGTPVLSIAPSPATGFIRLTESTQTLNKADWPELSSWLAALSTPYPWGSATLTFNLPPAAGYVLRFAGTTSSIDPDGPRTAGSTQTDLVKAHTHTGTTAAAGSHSHTFPYATTGISGGGGSAVNTIGSGGSTGTTTTQADHTHTFTSDSTGGAENRPKNVAMHVDIFASSALAVGTLGAFGFSYQWDTGTTAADPGAGRVRGNNATFGSITALYISQTDGWGVDIGGVLTNISANYLLRLTKIAAPGTSGAFKVNGTPTDNGVYWTIPVAVSASGGSLSANDSLSFELSGQAGSGYGGTSTSSVTLGTGAKSLTTQTGLAWTAGARVRWSASTSNWMEGTITSYDTATGAMAISVAGSSDVSGSGTYTSWTINTAGYPGASGAVAPGGSSKAAQYNASGSFGAAGTAGYNSSSALWEWTSAGATGGGFMEIPQGANAWDYPAYRWSYADGAWSNGSGSHVNYYDRVVCWGHNAKAPSVAIDTTVSMSWCAHENRFTQPASSVTDGHEFHMSKKAPGAGGVVSITTSGGAITAITVTTAGSYYIVGQVLPISGGNADGMGKVTAVDVSGGLVTVIPYASAGGTSYAGTGYSNATGISVTSREQRLFSYFGTHNNTEGDIISSTCDSWVWYTSRGVLKAQADWLNNALYFTKVKLRQTVNNVSVFQQQNAAGTAWIDLPFINASDQMVVTAPVYQVVAGASGLDNIWYNTTSGQYAAHNLYAPAAETYYHCYNITTNKHWSMGNKSGSSDSWCLAAGVGLGSNVALTVDQNLNVAIGSGALATNATNGFLYIPTCAGTPTGVPTTITGRVPVIFDTTNHKLYVYDGGWKGGTNPGALT